RAAGAAAPLGWHRPRPARGCARPAPEPAAGARSAAPRARRRAPPPCPAPRRRSAGDRGGGCRRHPPRAESASASVVNSEVLVQNIIIYQDGSGSPHVRGGRVDFGPLSIPKDTLLSRGALSVSAPSGKTGGVQEA